MIKIPDAKTARLSSDKNYKEYLDRRQKEITEKIEAKVLQQISDGHFCTSIGYEHQLSDIGDMTQERIIPMLSKMGYKAMLVRAPLIKGGSIESFFIDIEWKEEIKDE